MYAVFYLVWAAAVVHSLRQHREDRAQKSAHNSKTRGTAMHRTTVAAQLRRAGVALRRQGVPADRLDEAVQLYSAGWSLQRLAERYDCDDETVRQTLKRAGVWLRVPWQRLN